MKLKEILISLIIFEGITCCAQTDSTLLSSMERDIQRSMSRFQAVGVSVAIVKDNKILYKKAFGYNPNYNDSSERRPIPSDGLYWIASISKTFVATAIMQLAEKGKLSIDDDVNKYLAFRIKNPSFPDTPITIRMLLSHRSSLNDYQYEYSFNKINPEVNSDYYMLYNTYKPGTDYDYCNLGYNILGAIIEKVSGCRFDDYIQQHIIKPLHLYGGFDVSKLDSTKFVWTYIYDHSKNEFVKDKYLFTYYKRAADNYQIGYTTPIFSPAGGMKISVEDLAKYMMMHMNDGKYGGRRIIKRESEKKMREIHTQEKHYALSFRHYNNLGYRVLKDVELIGQTGGSHGIHSSMIFNPKEKYGFVIICNGCTSKYPDGADFNKEIINICYHYLIKTAQ